jgi:hypothetical protein
MKKNYLEALVMRHAVLDEMIVMQHSAEEIIRQSVDAEYNTFTLFVACQQQHY